MIATQRVHPREGIVKGLANFQTGATEAIRRPWVVIGAGLLVAALAGAPMPLPELALLGPWIASAGAGRNGARAAAAVGFASFLLFAHAAPVSILMAAALAGIAAWGVPAAVEAQERAAANRRESNGGASAIAIDCEGFASLDESYGPGTSDHVFSMLRRAVEQETRDTDLVVHIQGHELALILDGSSPEVGQAVMRRVEHRFSQWLSDAGYECNLSVGLSGIDEDEAAFEGLMRVSRQPDGPYLD